jgi:DNA-binding MarR family transcriptional regulator
MPTTPTRRTSSHRTTVEEDGRALLTALDQLLRAYQFRDRQRICYHGLSINECYALQAVVHRKGLTQNELAAVLYLDNSTTSRLLDGLERRGHVAREPDPCDGRANRLAATEKGRRLHARIQEDLVRQHLSLIDDLPSDSRRAAILVISRLAKDASSRFQPTD